jgi:hypothetical protein
MNATYRQINYTDGTRAWGAYVDLGFNRRTRRPEHDMPAVGDTIAVRTKGGETHQRVIARICQQYKTGALVALVADAEVAATAQQRYAAAVRSGQAQDGGNGRGIDQAALHRDGRPCPRCQSYCYGDCEAS